MSPTAIKQLEDSVLQNPQLNVQMTTSTAHRLTHYDGVCSSVHGHNLDWDVTVRLDHEPNGEDNMSTDFKTVADIIDSVDHAVLLNAEDELVDGDALSFPEAVIADWGQYYDDQLGNVLVFEGDPTCELLALWLSERIIEEVDEAYSVSVELAETEKYSFENNLSEFELEQLRES